MDDIDLISYAIAAKQIGRKSKGRLNCHIFITNNKQKLYFLEQLAKKIFLPAMKDLRIQIIYQQGLHWLTVDILINGFDTSIFIIDSWEEFQKRKNMILGL